MFNNIPQNVKTIIVSTGPLALVLILFLFMGNFGITKINDLRTQTDQAQIEQNVLTQKLNVLRNVSSTLGNSPNLATAAIPNVNSAVFEISQLKNLASQNSVVFSDIKASASLVDTTGLSRIDITFDVEGTRDQITAFLKSISTAAPISLVDSVKLNASTGAGRATVTVKSYWAPLPTKLPAVTAALNDLTPDEKTVLTSISTLTQPLFLTLPAASEGGKTDPFSQ